MEAAVQLLKNGKSAGVDNIPAEMVQAGGEDVITALMIIYNKIWQTGEWSTPCPYSSHFQERQPAAVPELPNDQLISHPSKVMLKITLNRSKPQAEKIIAEEQAG